VNGIRTVENNHDLVPLPGTVHGELLEQAIPALGEVAAVSFPQLGDPANEVVSVNENAHGEPSQGSGFEFWVLSFGCKPQTLVAIAPQVSSAFACAYRTAMADKSFRFQNGSRLTPHHAPVSGMTMGEKPRFPDIPPVTPKA
jgi:hypothetical protein